MNTQVGINQLEQYLKRNLAKDIISYVLATHDYKEGNHWYIHPNNQPGETIDIYFDRDGEMNQRVAICILKVKAALIANDYNEAYHWLYKIASPNFDKNYEDVWKNVEQIADGKGEDDSDY